MNEVARDRVEKRLRDHWVDHGKWDVEAARDVDAAIAELPSGDKRIQLYADVASRLSVLREQFVKSIDLCFADLKEIAAITTRKEWADYEDRWGDREYHA